MKLGDVYHGRYVIEKKLGWGHFSTVWLATDTKVADDHPDKLVAIKIQKSASHYYDAALDEIELLTEIAQHALPNPVRRSPAVPLLPCLLQPDVFVMRCSHCIARGAKGQRHEKCSVWTGTHCRGPVAG